MRDHGKKIVQFWQVAEHSWQRPQSFLSNGIPTSSELGPKSWFGPSRQQAGMHEKSSGFVCSELAWIISLGLSLRPTQQMNL